MGVYDDKFEEVMSFVEGRMNSRGKRLQINSVEDLKTALIELDLDRVEKNSKPKFTQSKDGTYPFFEKLFSSKAAAKAVTQQKIYGSFGPVVTFKGAVTPGDKRATDRALELQKEGRDVYSYGEGYAVKGFYLSKKGKKIMYFSDVDNGRRVSKKLLVA